MKGMQVTILFFFLIFNFFFFLVLYKQVNIFCDVMIDDIDSVKVTYNTIFSEFT
jgi:hypothetical protein